MTERYMRRAETLGQSIDAPEIRAFLVLAKGMASFSLGRLPDAATLLEEAERICAESCTRKMSTLEMSRAF